MTRTDRIAAQLARTQERLKTLKQEQAQNTRHTKSAQYRTEQQARRKRCALVGAMAEQAGLFGLEDAELLAVFQALAPLVHVEQPAAVLEACLGELLTVAHGAAREGRLQ